MLATADGASRVDAAIYGRPPMNDDGTATFAMADRLTHRNLTANPSACYLFHEAGPGWKGRRLYLTRVAERSDPKDVAAARPARRRPCMASDEGLYAVTFHVDRVLPLVGPPPARTH